MDANGELPILVFVVFVFILAGGVAEAPVIGGQPYDVEVAAKAKLGAAIDVSSSVGDVGDAAAGIGAFLSKRGALKLAEEAGETAVQNWARPGKRGGAAHQAKVNELETEIPKNNPGLTHVHGGSLPEKMAKGTSRFPDLIFKDQAGKEYFVQVGLMTKDGWPVKREWDAIMDLFDHAESVDFVPYN